MRIPHSVFLEWDKDDRDKATWHYLRERSRCRGCGTLPEEWDENRGGSRHAYAVAEHQCRGCQLLESHREGVSKRPPIQRRGLQVYLDPPKRIR